MAAGGDPGVDKIVARVGVRVLPDTSGFTSDLKAKLDEIESRLKVEIPTSLDTSGVLKDVQALNARLKASSDRLTIGVEADTARAAASVEAIKRKISATTAKIDVRADDSFARNVQTQITKALRDVEPHIPITADGEQFRRDVAAKVKLVEETIRVGVPLEVDKAADWRAQVLADIAEIEAFTKRIHPDVTIETHVDRSKLDAVQEAFSGLVGSLNNAFSNPIDKLSQLGGIVQQVELLSARTIARVTLLGPPILLAAAGALALAPSLATALPVLGEIGAAVGVVALGFDSLFGAKQKGKPRSGGVFDPLHQEILGLKDDIGSLLSAGLEPLVAKLQSSGTFAAFKNGLLGVASAVNVALRGVTEFASSTEAATGTKAVFGAITNGLRDLAVTAAPLSRSLLQITVAALPGFQILNTYIATSILRFSNFIERINATGQLTRVITTATQDLIGFVSGVGRIAGAVINVLQALEPTARAVFGVLGSGLETALNGIANGIANFRIGDTVFAPLLTGLATFIASVRGLPGEFLRALAPLVQSQEFATFVTNLGRVVLELSIHFAELAKGAVAVASGLIQLVGIPVVGLFGNLLGDLADLLQALNANQTQIAALAAVVVARFIPAMLLAARGGVTVLLLALQPVAAAISGFAVAVGRVAVAAVAVLVNACANVIASVAGMDAALVSSSVELGVLRTAAATAGATLRGLGVALLSVTAIATAGLAVALVGLVGGLNAWSEAQQKAADETDKVKDAFNPLDEAASKATIERLRATAQAAVDAGQKVSTFGAGWELFGRGINAATFGLIGNSTTPIADLAARGLDAAKAMKELQTQLDNVQANVKAVAADTGLSVEQIKELAAAGKIDLSKPFADSANARGAVISQLDLIRAKTGLTAEALVAAAGPSTAAWQQFAKAIEDAQAAVQKSFSGQTDIIAAFKPDSANKSVQSAADAVTKAQQRVDDAQARIDSAASARRKVTAADLRSLATAQDALTKAQDKSSTANAASAAAQLGPTYARLLKQTQEFTKNIDIAIQKGLDPQLVTRLLEAGPEQAAPFLQAIASQHGDRLVKLANDTEKAISAINARVLEQTRLVTIATQSGTDKMITDLQTASKIAALKAADPAKATAEAIAKSLKLPQGQIQAIADEFGISLVDAVQAAVEIRPITLNAKVGTVTAKQAQLEKRAAGFRTGGLVSGPGTWTSDSILARLSNMEFVQPAHVVAHYGVDVMEALRSGAIPREALQALARGQDGLAHKLAAMAPPAPPQARRAPRPVMASAAGHDLPAGAGGPMTLVLVDHDGSIIGTMRAEIARNERQSHQAKRLSQLGSTSGRR